jgi:hypothetical protein
MNNNGYYNFWKVAKIEQPLFTEMELALMEGGQSLEQPESDTYSFLKYVTEPTLGPLSSAVSGVRMNKTVPR